MAENKTEFLITARDETREAFRSVEAGLSRVSAAMGGMLAPLAVLASVAGFGALIKSQIDLGDQLNKTSQKLGITVEGLSAYQYAAKLSDVGNEQLTSGLSRLTKTMAEAASNGSGPAAAAFRALNVSVTDTSGNLRPLNTVLDEVSARFADTRDGTNKTAMAMAVFGKSGAELVPLLNNLREMSAEARRTGNIVSTEFAQKSEQLNDSLMRLEKASGNFARTLAGALVPALASMIERLNVAIGAQESLSLGLLQKDKDFLQVEYKAMMQAAEKGYIINIERAAFLKQQIDALNAQIAAAESKAAAGTGAGTKNDMASVANIGIGDKEAEQTAKYMAELQKQMEALYMSTATKLEALGIEQAEKQALIDQGYLNGLISEQLYYEQSAALNQQYQDKLTAAALQGASARDQKDAAAQAANNKMWESGQTGKLEVLGGVLGGMSKLMQSSSKKQFEIGKKAAMGEALIATYMSAVSAFKALSGIPYVGPALGAVAAAAAIAFGLSNVQRISSQKFGGGGAGGGSVPTFSGSPNTGLPTAESSAPVAPSLPLTAQATSQPRIVNITLESASGMLSAEYVRDVLIPGINDAVGDGVTLRMA